VAEHFPHLRVIPSLSRDLTDTAVLYLIGEISPFAWLGRDDVAGGSWLPFVILQPTATNVCHPDDYREEGSGIYYSSSS